MCCDAHYGQRKPERRVTALVFLSPDVTRKSGVSTREA